MRAVALMVIVSLMSALLLSKLVPAAKDRVHAEMLCLAGPYAVNM